MFVDRSVTMKYDNVVLKGSKVFSMLASSKSYCNLIRRIEVRIVRIPGGPRY